MLLRNLSCLLTGTDRCLAQYSFATYFRKPSSDWVVYDVSFSGLIYISLVPDSKRSQPSAKNISVRAEWLRQSGRAPSEPSETPRWQTTPRPAPIRRIRLHIALRSRFLRFFSLCRYPIVHEHCGVVANWDDTSVWVHWEHQQNVSRSGSHTQGSISTRHFVYHIRLCYCHKIHYLIIWHALFKYLDIYTYGQAGHRW